MSRLIVLAASAALLASGCRKPPPQLELVVGETRTQSETVDVGDAASVDVGIKLGIGEIRLSGGADRLLEAAFTYNISSWKPEVKYEVPINQSSSPHPTHILSHYLLLLRRLLQRNSNSSR